MLALADSWPVFRRAEVMAQVGERLEPAGRRILPGTYLGGMSVLVAFAVMNGKSRRSATLLVNINE